MARTIIAGSRSFPNEDRARTKDEERSQHEVSKRAILAAIDDARCSGLVIDTVLSGGARGADRVGEVWAQMVGIPVEQFIPDWNGPLGKRAGFARNREMAERADAAIIVWSSDFSAGARNMLEEAITHGLAVYLYLFDGEHLRRDNDPGRHLHASS